MLEDDEYYDSIDDSEFESCRSFCNPNFQETDPELEEDDIKMEDTVPFYTGNVEKSEVESIKNESKSNSCASLKNKLKKRKNILPSMGNRKNRSYLTMFYEKNGMQGKAEASTSNKSTCVNMSPKSCFSCRNGEESNHDQANVNSERGNSENENGVIVREEVERNSKISLLQDSGNSCSVTTLRDKISTISEIQILELKNNSESSKVNKRRIKPVKVTELGGLGPNIAHDKLELLRKRQNYGRLVTEKNRIKLLETKVVQKLNQEIRESTRV